MSNTLLTQGTGDAELDKALALAGYAYDPIQDIFYSTMDPWQRSIGYCRLYDEAAAPLGMIIDCEPIYFNYDNKKWMIGIWKGQYDLVSGAEIGVYTKGMDLKFPPFFQMTYYQSADNENCLDMAFTLKKGEEILFTRQGHHWWLTGFALGKFSEPSELLMEIKITLKSAEMRDAFLNGMQKIGYTEADYQVEGNTVWFTFSKPRSPQPITRTPKTDWLMQRKNELLCRTYQQLTAPYPTFPEKIAAVKRDFPEIYNLIINMGKSKKIYEIFVILTLLGALLLTRYTLQRLD